MPSPFADTFMKTLQQTEQSGDPAPLVALFAADAELTNLARKEPHTGLGGAREFWTEYLHAFGKIASEFHHVAEGDGTIVLEWVSDGTLPNGSPIRYSGISVLETGGADKVRKFRTYYDSAAFVAPKEAEPAGK